jgi:small subunit ribosomal protein S3
VGQKVHPYGFRLGIYKDWHARWFAKKSYAHELHEDFAIRKYLQERLSNVELSNIMLEKTGDSIRINISTSRPGMIIGKKGQSIESLRNDLGARFKKNIDISVQEIKNQDLDARLVARAIADQIERRVSYKRLTKKAGFAAMKSGAKGIKICCSGRLGGAEIARTEWLRLGSVPLHTLRADVDYALAEAKTTYGMIGIKVWICKGEV